MINIRKRKVLNLALLPNLKCLQCRSGDAETIELSKSPELISLDLCGCKMKALNVSNHIRLENLCIDYCDNLKSRTRVWLEDQLEDNFK